MKTISDPGAVLPAMLDKKTVLDILDRINRRKFPTQLGWENSQMAACVQLIDSGHLDGCVVLDSAARPTKIYGICLAAAGQEILDEYEAPPVSRFVLLRLHRLVWRISFSCIFLGLLIALPKQNTSLEKLTAENADHFNSQQSSQLHELKNTPQATSRLQTTGDLQSSSARFFRDLCAKNSEHD